MQKEFLTPIFILVLFLGITFFALPRWQEIQALNKDIKALDRVRAQTQAYVAEIERAEGKLASYQKGVAVVNSALPKRFFQPLMLTYLKKFASENGVLLKGINFSAETQTSPEQQNQGQSGLRSIPISIGVIGSYDSCQVFLKALEQSSRLFNITGFSMGKAEKSQEGVLLSCQIQAKIYSYQ